MDFMSDNFANGRKIRLLNILEVFTKESLAMVVDTSINGMRVSQILDQISWMRGWPEVITVSRKMKRHSLCFIIIRLSIGNISAVRTR